MAQLLSELLPGARLCGNVWELPGRTRGVHLDGRGLLLLPSFHWTGGPLVADPPGIPGRTNHPVAVTYPAGSGLPPQPDGATGPQALAKVIGTTRTERLRLVGEEHTTTEFARRLRVGAATISTHTSALRGSGLISTSRSGKAVLHRRTASAACRWGEAPKCRPSEPDGPYRGRGRRASRRTFPPLPRPAVRLA